MKAKEMIWSVVILLLIGCTAVTTPEEPAATAVPTEPSLQEMPPVNDETPEDAPAEIEAPEVAPTPTSDKQVSEPVTVDLGAVTPVPLESTPVVQPAPGSPGIKDPVALATTDLSQRLGVAAETIELVSLLEVTWPDGSLGCPEAGVAYTQALVPGQQMILQVNGVEYYYHSGKNSVFTYCSDPQPPLDTVPTNPLEPIPGQDD